MIHRLLFMGLLPPETEHLFHFLPEQPKPVFNHYISPSVLFGLSSLSVSFFLSLSFRYMHRHLIATLATFCIEPITLNHCANITFLPLPYWARRRRHLSVVGCQRYLSADLVLAL